MAISPASKCCSGPLTRIVSRVCVGAGRRGRWLLGPVVLLSWALVLLPAAGAVAAATSTPKERAWRWRRMEVPVSTGLAAVAVDAASQRLAVGDSEGVSLRHLDDAPEDRAGASGSRSRWQRVALPGAVVDLVFGPAGGVWAATLRGLWWIDPSGKRQERSPAPGEAARRVNRVAVVSGFVVVATDAGLFVSPDGRIFVRLTDGLPLGPVLATAVRPIGPEEGGSAQVEIWLIANEHVWRLTVLRRGGMFEATPAREVEIPGRPASQPVVDLAADLKGHDIVVLFTRSIARSLEARPGQARFEVVYPVLGAGTLALRIVEIAGGVWLATNQGLMAALAWPGRFERAAAPAGTAATLAVAGGAEALFAVGPSGLLEGRPVVAARRATRVWSIPEDPDLRRVHEMALERAGLEPRYFRSLRRRMGRRGWFPALSLRAAAAYDRDTRADYDETFTSGDLRRLNDRLSARSRDFEGWLTLSWDFGDVVYNREAPDLSREERQVITLRDNVLDEINQLYFDRRRTLVALAAYADRRDPEAVALRIRARELAAGLDAWTGGWFTAELEAHRLATKAPE